MAGIILNQLHESPNAKQREAAELLDCTATANDAWDGNVEGCSSGTEAGGYERWPDELHRAAAQLLPGAIQAFQAHNPFYNKLLEQE